MRLLIYGDEADNNGNRHGIAREAAMEHYRA